jgi:phosphoglycerate dehydrogenase-like enzyme
MQAAIQFCQNRSEREFKDVGELKHKIFITTPLPPANVASIRAVDPAQVEVIYEPDLLPPIRYIGDHGGAPFARDRDQERRWREALSNADILWDLPRTTDDMAAASRVKWIQTTSTGVGQDVLALGILDSDILITTARGVHAGPLAEFVFMALLAHFRGLPHLMTEQRAHRWVRHCGEEVAGKTVTVLGAGDLARGIAKIGRAFDMRVVAVARDVLKQRSDVQLFDAVYPTEDLHRVLAVSDAFVVAVPHTPATENMIDEAAFRAMKPGIAFVNIGRGQVVDEAALIGDLRSGRIGFACLDVTAIEPLPPESPLWDLPNVLISPHSASTVITENDKITEIFCHNLRCFLDGRTTNMKNILDKRLMY